VFAPAKINLTLEILGRRVDGYHALRSVMVPVALYDEITVAPAPQFSFVCDPPALAEDNLVLRALALLDCSAAPLAITLRKAIPVGAGLGGGSSDAAAILRAAMRGEFGALGERDWIGLARSLGSDIPFFLVESGALVEGTGERVTALGALPAWWVVIAIPPVAVPTGEAYRALAAAREKAPAHSRVRSDSASIRVLEAVQRADFATVCAHACNDFEPIVTALAPRIAADLAALREAGAPLAMLSGSGACSFALCESEETATTLLERIVAPPDTRVLRVPFAPATTWR